MKTHAFPIQLAKEALLLGHFDKLIPLIEPQSKTDNLDAKFLYGYLYFWDDNLDRNHAIELITSAADAGHAEANYILAVCPDLVFPYRFTLPQDESTLKRLKVAAELGSIAALTDLAYCHYEGIGVKKDARFARQLLQKVFDYRRIVYPKCNLLLASMLLEGIGGDVDAENGIFALRYCVHENGDPYAIKALEWYIKIAKNGEYEQDEQAVVEYCEPYLKVIRENPFPLWHRFIRYHCMNSLKYDLQDASFDAFSDFVFDHFPRVRHDHDSFRWDRQAQVLFDPKQLLHFYTQLFQSSGFLPDKYSIDQIDQGFGTDGIRGWAHWTIGCVLGNAENTIDDAVACIRAMYGLFVDLFSEPYYIDIGFMWWDIGYGACGNNWRTDPNLKMRQYKPEDGTPLGDASFETMVRVLQLKYLSCQRAAIHGLGHSHHPDKEKVLRKYLDEHPDLPEEIRIYAMDAIEGSIL